MAKSIIELTRGIPTTAKGWLDIFSRINKFLQVSGDELIIGGDIKLPAQSVGTDELEDGGVTDEKLRESQAHSVIGRPVGTAGPPTDIQAGTDRFYLRQAGGVVSFGPIDEPDLPASIARDSDVASAVSSGITAHELAIDPHPGYLTQAEGDARYRELTDAVTYGEITGKPAVFAFLYSGTGTPEGAVVAGVGSLFLRTDGGASTTLYIKESGAANTGWVAK